MWNPFRVYVFRAETEYVFRLVFLLVYILFFSYTHSLKNYTLTLTHSCTHPTMCSFTNSNSIINTLLSTSPMENQKKHQTEYIFRFNKKKNRNGFGIPFQLCGKRIPNFVSFKKKKNTETDLEFCFRSVGNGFQIPFP